MWFTLAIIIIVFLYIIIPNLFEDKDAPFVPTQSNIVQRVVELADIKKGDVVYDLGSGDGRMLIVSAMLGATAYGIELSLFRVWYSRLWIWALRLSRRAKVIHTDIFDADLGKASVVICYLLQETNDKLQAKLKKELKQGTRVVSVAFEFKGWKVEKQDLKSVIYGPLRLYKM